MRLFHNDYNEICHPLVLARLNQMQGMQMPGYGVDSISADAAQKIRAACNDTNLSVHFLVGGTQTNLTVISAALRPHHGVISADTGHINVHETGAIEATGHKVIALTSVDGKISAQQVIEVAQSHADDPDAEHTVRPKLVYISFPTEYGTIYSKKELEALSSACKRYGMYLFVDGARMGYGLAAADNDLTLSDFARLCDVFYIGGTKVGTMFGEAVVIANPAIAEDFRYLTKRHGGMLAKGWLTGAQFQTLFENDLYLEISAHANRMADRIRQSLEKAGIPLYINNNTNQIFPIMPDSVLAEIEKECTFVTMNRIDDTHCVARFCTSWASKEEDVAFLCSLIEKYPQ